MSSQSSLFDPQPVEEPTEGKPWTDEQDRLLIAYGHALGGSMDDYEVVGQRLLDRAPGEAIARIEWLREDRSMVVYAVEYLTERDPATEVPRLKELNRKKV